MLEGWRESGGPFGEDAGALAEIFADLVATGREQGGDRWGIAHARIGTLLYSLYLGTLFDWIDGADDVAPFPLVATLRDLVDMVLDGAGGPAPG